jgi:hypothetical protein
MSRSICLSHRTECRCRRWPFIRWLLALEEDHYTRAAANTSTPDPPFDVVLRRMRGFVTIMIDADFAEHAEACPQCVSGAEGTADRMTGTPATT